MRHAIILNGREVQYELRRYKRSKHIRFYVDEKTKGLNVSAPHRASLKHIESAIREHEKWVLEQLIKSSQKRPSFIDRMTEEDYERYKKQALSLITQRVEHFNSYYRYQYKRISIRNQKTRWGSCSTSGTLSFNFKLLFLPEKQRDYIIVHEICHLKEHNHSPAFWALVAQTIPDYKSVRKLLKDRSLY